MWSEYGHYKYTCPRIAYGKSYPWKANSGWIISTRSRQQQQQKKNEMYDAGKKNSLIITVSKDRNISSHYSRTIWITAITGKQGGR